MPIVHRVLVGTQTKDNNLYVRAAYVDLDILRFLCGQALYLHNNVHNQAGYNQNHKWLLLLTY